MCSEIIVFAHVAARNLSNFSNARREAGYQCQVYPIVYYELRRALHMCLSHMVKEGKDEMRR